MPDFDNTNRGSIWKNDKMRDGKQDPDFTGSLNVDGVEYWVSAWKRKEGAAATAPALSFTVKPKEAKPAPQRKPSGSDNNRARPSLREEINEDIPF